MKCPNAEEVVYTLKEKKYYDQIEKAYSYASRLLLDLLIDEKELLARIRLVNFYHFLGKFSRWQIDDGFSYFSHKINFDISCILP